LAEFAYVTDGACTEDEILDQELIILKVNNYYFIEDKLYLFKFVLFHSQN